MHRNSAVACGSGHGATGCTAGLCRGGASEGQLLSLRRVFTRISGHPLGGATRGCGAVYRSAFLDRLASQAGDTWREAGLDEDPIVRDPIAALADAAGESDGESWWNGIVRAESANEAGIRRGRRRDGGGPRRGRRALCP